MTTPNNTSDEDKATFETIERALGMTPAVKVRFKLEKAERRALVFLLSVIAALIVVIVWGCYALGVQREQELKDTYAVWVKVTGNPGDLTYEEWKLVRLYIQAHPSEP